jgi:chromosomal replication initiator protein
MTFPKLLAVKTSLQTVNNQRTARSEAVATGHWAGVLRYLSSVFPKEVFSTWFAPIRCLEESENGVILSVESDFAAIWVEDNYLDLIRKQFNLLYSKDIPVALKVGAAASREVELPASRTSPDAIIPLERTVVAAERVVRSVANSHRARRNQITLNPRYTFDNFIVGPSNQLAHADMGWSVAQIIWTGPTILLLSTSFSGMGKKHLMPRLPLT